MLGLVAIGLTDYTTVVGAFTSGFGNYLIATLFDCFMFVGILDQTGLTNFLAHGFLSRKFIKGRPFVLFLMILCGVEFIGTFANAFAACFILWGLFLEMVQLAGYTKKEPFVSFMICAILFIAMVSGVIMPFHSGGVMYIGFFTNATGLVMNDIAFIVINALIVNLFIIVLLAFLKFVVRPDLSKFTEATEAFSLVKSMKMTR